MNCVGGVVPPPVFNSKTNIIAMEKSPNLRQIPSKLAWDLSGQRWLGLPKGKGVMINRLFQGQNCPKPFSLPPVGLAALPLPCHFFHQQTLETTLQNIIKVEVDGSSSLEARRGQGILWEGWFPLSLHHFSWRISNRK